MRTFALVPFLFGAVLLAQSEPTLEWQKRSTSIRYNAVPVGKHGLSELKVGDTWRLGMNQASTWQVAMPILAGDTWIAPGQYRVNLQRRDEEQCAVVANGSGSALGGSGDGALVGKVGKSGKPTKSLTIGIAKKGAATFGNQPAQMTVQFGESEWNGEMLLVGNKTVPVTGGKLAVFTIPAAQMEKGPVPIATWSRGKDGEDSWNVVVDKDAVRLVPWMSAPTESFGFGAVVPPDSSQQTEGKVTPVEAKAEKDLETLELREATATKSDLRLVVAWGKKTVECLVPLPKPKK